MQLFRSTRGAFLLAAVLGFPAAGHAGTTWYVDDANGADIASGGEEDSPFETISYAVSMASDGDLILVADGTYGHYISYFGKQITIQSINGPDACTIDCAGEVGVSLESGETRQSVLDGFKIINAGVSAIQIAHSNPTIRNCIIRGNDSDTSGAGVYGVSAGPLIENCEFKNNEASWFGGALYLEGGGNAELIGCSFVDNRAMGGDSSGGAVFVYRSTADPMSVIVKDCTFSQNVTTQAGGAMVAGGDDDSIPLSLKIDNCTFEGNHALMLGGALYAVHCDPLDIIATDILSNTAVQSGGGLDLRSCRETRFLDCTIAGNTSEYNVGGGVYVYQEAVEGSNVQMLSCRIAGNSAYGSGGGLYVQGGDCFVTNSLVVGNVSQTSLYGISSTGGIFCNTPRDVEVNNCTFTGNEGVDVGGFQTERIQGSLKLHNSILWDNSPSQMSHGVEDEVYVAYCDVQGGFPPEWDGGGNINIDPLFEDVVNFQRPWSDNDYHLSSMSPCIDAGSDLLVPPDTRDLDGDGDTAERIPLDIEGSFRIADSREVVDTGVPDPPDYPAVVDMGAYEMAAYCIGEEITPPEDIADRIDYAETVSAEGWINPPTAAFYHACIPGTPGGDDCSRRAIFAADEKVSLILS